MSSSYLRSSHRLIARGHNRTSSGYSVRRSSSTHSQWPKLQHLSRPTVAQFQAKAFASSIPHHLQTSFDLPAITRWVDKSEPAGLDEPYFTSFQETLHLPMELTTTDPTSSFVRTSAPLAIFLGYLRQLKDIPQHESSPRMYIAQASLELLPEALRGDLPTPEFVLKAGKGDVYDSSLWMGPSFAARTPLHRDPNPNILVQVAGTKSVRLLPPVTGQQIYHHVKGKLRSTGGESIGTMRGEEMMGEEGKTLDRIIWEDSTDPSGACEAILKPGDGIFIPDGWWHSIRGLHTGINISVNWWFR